VSRRTEDGSYRVSRVELAAFAERRRRPAVRVGYDVTATTEKSILDYATQLALNGHRAQPVVVLERRSRSNRWHDLADAIGVVLDYAPGFSAVRS
jgi:hypothetical protein